MNIRVECFSGKTADESPIKFWIEDVVLFIESIMDQWQIPKAQYFRVRADDGNTYVLRHDREKDEWGLESFRSGKQGIIATDPEAESKPN
jgi:hypothetical protein